MADKKSDPEMVAGKAYSPQGTKYGSRNCSILMEGDDVVVRIDAKSIIGKKGDPKDPTQPMDAKENPLRKKHLVGTSGGFRVAGDVDVSISVTC